MFVAHAHGPLRTAFIILNALLHSRFLTDLHQLSFPKYFILLFATVTVRGARVKDIGVNFKKMEGTGRFGRMSESFLEQWPANLMLKIDIQVKVGVVKF
jgi:hypothetical protein